jgi:hypothetical protein
MARNRFRNNIIAMTALGVLALVAAGFSFGNVPMGMTSLNYATLFVGIFLLVFSLVLFFVGRVNEGTTSFLVEQTIMNHTM